MLNRRSLLAGAAILAPLAAPVAASAQRHPAKPKAPAIPTGTPATTSLGPLDTAAKWAFVIDFNSGATLLDKDADATMPPSSMTKLMTMYIVYGLLKSGRLSLNQELPVSEKAWKMQGSKMFVPLGGQVRVEDLIRGVVVDSGNDACLVLAEAIAGSEDQFVDLMNQKAAEIGLTNTHYRNCTGWPDPDQHMSCRDIAHHRAPRDRRIPRILPLRRRKIVQIQQHRAREPQPARPERPRGRSKDRPYRRRRLRRRRPVPFAAIAASSWCINGLVPRCMPAARRASGYSNGRSASSRTSPCSPRPTRSMPPRSGSAPRSSVPLVGGRDLIITMPRQWRQTAKIEVQFQSPVTCTRSAAAKYSASSWFPARACPRWTSRLLAGADVPRQGLPGRASVGGLALRAGVVSPDCSSRSRAGRAPVSRPRPRSWPIGLTAAGHTERFAPESPAARPAPEIPARSCSWAEPSIGRRKPRPISTSPHAPSTWRAPFCPALALRHHRDLRPLCRLDHGLSGLRSQGADRALIASPHPSLLPRHPDLTLSCSKLALSLAQPRIASIAAPATPTVMNASTPPSTRRVAKGFAALANAAPSPHRAHRWGRGHRPISRSGSGQPSQIACHARLHAKIRICSATPPPRPPSMPLVARGGCTMPG